MKEVLKNIKRYADIRLIEKDIQIELKENVKVNMEYLQKLICKLKENKFEAIQVMKRQQSMKYLEEGHRQAIKDGYLYLKDYDDPGEKYYSYEKQITRNGFIYIVNSNGTWSSYRQSDVKVEEKREREIKSIRNIIEDSDLMHVLERTETYIRNYLNFIKKAS